MLRKPKDPKGLKRDKKSLNKNLKKYNKIAILGFHGLGDTIMFLPTIRALGNHFKNSHIYILVKNKSTNELLDLADLPLNTSIIYFNKYSSHRLKISPLNFAVFFKILKLNPEMIFAMTKLNKYLTPIILKLSKSKITIGESEGFGNYLITHPVKIDRHIHRVFQNLSLLNPLNIPSPNKVDVNLYPDEVSLGKISSLLKTLLSAPPKICFGIAPSVTKGHPERLWPSKYWADLIALLLENFDAACFVLGGKSRWDKKISREIFSNLPQSINAYDLVGKLSIKETTALISTIDSICGVDNGLLHIAVAVNTYIHAIWSITPRDHYPFTKKLQIINVDCQCKENYPKNIQRECHKKPKCLYRLKPETVFKNIEEIWKSRTLTRSKIESLWKY